MNQKALRIALLSTLLAGSLASCGGGEKKPGQAPDPAASNGGSTGEAAPSGELSPPAQIDTSDGTLRLTGEGFAAGTWSFKDVTAYVDEKTGGGKTESVLELEAHDGTANMHFKLRLHGGGPLAAGTYTIGGSARRADARWEAKSVMFNSAFGGEGTVQLTAIDSAHAAGTFSISLISPATSNPTDTIRTNDPAAPKETLKGSFNQKLK